MKSGRSTLCVSAQHARLRTGWRLRNLARLQAVDAQLVFPTGSYVVCPLFFPGGDIGKLAVLGTIDDLAVCGAEPLYFSLAFIIEEGLPVDRDRSAVGRQRRQNTDDNRAERR